VNYSEECFYNQDKNLMHKWDHYFEIYDRHFKKYRNQNIVILEIGVFHGGSLQMWRDYFGPKAKIYGLDINPKCKVMEKEGFRIFIGDQSDKKFLRSLKEEIPPIDILIDDGGHTMEQQIATYEVLFPHVTENGIYLCEDLHTSYWNAYGGGYKKPGTFIEYAKSLVDDISAFHSRNPASKDRDFKVTDFTRSANSIHFYDSVCVIEKRKRGPPKNMAIGTTKIL
jgi:hypothetical protein